jgi:hypothetical protein
MQRLLKKLIVAAALAFVTPALVLAAANDLAATKAAGRSAKALQEQTARQNATAERQAALAAKMALVAQMKGSSDPNLRVKLFTLQKGGK